MGCTSGASQRPRLQLRHWNAPIPIPEIFFLAILPADGDYWNSASLLAHAHGVKPHVSILATGLRGFRFFIHFEPENITRNPSVRFTQNWWTDWVRCSTIFSTVQSITKSIMAGIHIASIKTMQEL